MGFPTLMIGSDAKAVELYNELENQQRSSGNIFKGFIRVKDREHFPLEEHLPFLGTMENIKQVLEEQNIEEVIIALESSEHHELQQILNVINGHRAIIKVIPDMYDILFRFS